MADSSSPLDTAEMRFEGRAPVASPRCAAASRARRSLDSVSRSSWLALDSGS